MHSLSSPHLTRYFTQSDAERANVDAGHGRWHLHASQQSLFGSKYRRIWRISSTGMNFPIFARVEGTCVIVCHIPDNMCLQWSTAFLTRPPPSTAVNFTIPSKYCCEFHNTYSAIVLVQAGPKSAEWETKPINKLHFFYWYTISFNIVFLLTCVLLCWQ